MSDKKSTVKSRKNPDICVSYYQNDIDWLKNKFSRCIFYDKSWRGVPQDNYATGEHPPQRLKSIYPSLRVVETTPNGYNIADYLSYIIEFYDALPNHIYFIKGNAYPRHVDLDMALNFLDCNTPMGLNSGDHLPNGLAPTISTKIFIEANTSWYTDIDIHKPRYFSSFTAFLNFCFPSERAPTFLEFSPGACFSASATNIKNYPKEFYENLRSLILYSRLPAEALYLERYIECMLSKKLEVNEIMLTTLESETYTTLQSRCRSELESKKRWGTRPILKFLLRIYGFLYLKTISKL